MFMLILSIVQLFAALPKIWEMIKTIMDLIKILRTPEEKKAAKAELKGILVKYRGKKIDKKDKKTVAYEGENLHSELEKLKEKLKAKVQSV